MKRRPGHRVVVVMVVVVTGVSMAAMVGGGRVVL